MRLTVLTLTESLVRVGHRKKVYETASQRTPQCALIVPAIETFGARGTIEMDSGHHYLVHNTYVALDRRLYNYTLKTLPKPPTRVAYARHFYKDAPTSLA